MLALPSRQRPRPPDGESIGQQHMERNVEGFRV